ncbi:hypothetical protein P9VFCI_190 [Rhizobium phage P9VFCI]|uniref:Uncharacterized protein n=3 Tax=Innesvirus TaxID=3044739 RepID=A0A076YLU8_9CAUD|nr:hypothetical protein P10VF_102 [Rhizobium phage vB_RleM_P10VF]YP_010662083.1 hypothetical protein PP937_gp190 [Rhizobium phage P9VFCI]YP_010662286.1 hypothetical protein PP938_gp136 [Rhizobium phage AF3]AIK68315.1 hypothetical protein P10VF_102 [Rhizobium phage vB_RleM_P10VF]QNH71600.1 hypothetical protein AF3_136 [Rhizobium phage AF3]QNH72014.1 hypothetical protein P9VFCI_190 [Rhizobium phage P9VFCI]
MKTCCYVLEPATATNNYKLCGAKTEYFYRISIDSGRRERVYKDFCDKHLKILETDQDEEWN